MNEREAQDAHEAPRPAEGEAVFVKEREQKEDGRYIIFYTFDGEEKAKRP